MDIISLLDTLLSYIFKAEKDFFENPNEFHALEASVKASTDSFAAGFLSAILSELDTAIRISSWRKQNYTIQRRDTRTLICSVGDLSFDCTYYKGYKGNSEFVHLLENYINLDRNERFTACAEVAILTEALKTSCAEAANVLPSRQKISKTTVLNKVHSIAEDIPDTIYDEPKEVPYLFIEADEDHVAEQHGPHTDEEENKSFISKLIYIYEYKQNSTETEGRKELVKSELWHLLYSKDKDARSNFEKYTLSMMESAKSADKVDELRKYVLHNWAAVRRTLRNKLVDGCSAESHVSHVLSDRLSSRPMGWSQTGADRMSKLRCYDRNNGRSKIIELVK